MADLRKYITADNLRSRARLQEWIDKKDAVRGRPLTVAEKNANFMHAITHCDDCDTHVGFAEYCHHCGKHLG